MKRLLMLFVLMSCTAIMLGQELKVLDFHADRMMNDAVKYPKKDANGVSCGLVKLGLVLPEAEFEGDIISTEYNNGEWQIYMMQGANWITIKTQQYLPLRFDFPSDFPYIESNVTYVMVVEIPPSDSTDYFLELANEAVRENDMERLIQYIEKVPQNAVPDSLMVHYNMAMSIKVQNELYNSLKQKTRNFTTIPDRETFNLCSSFMAKYPRSEHFNQVSAFMKVQGLKFLEGQVNNPPPQPGGGKNSPIQPPMKKKDPFLSIGLGADPFFVFPDSSKIAYDTSKIYYGIGADAVLRIGRPQNTINALLGLGASTGSFIKPNLHATAEIRIKVETLYLGVGADIVLKDFEFTSMFSRTDTRVSANPCLRFMLGLSEGKSDIYLGVRYMRSLGGAVGLGFKWYLF